jgi:outer membrane protein OmpA-like peptidoglycan-associated protein
MAMYEQIKFAGADTALDAAGQKSIEELAPRLKQAKRFEIWGFGSADDKDPLSGAKARLDAVAKALASKGINKGSFTLVPVGAGWTEQGAVEFVMLTR